jgi:hypothetical protein
MLSAFRRRRFFSLSHASFFFLSSFLRGSLSVYKFTFGAKNDIETEKLHLEKPIIKFYRLVAFMHLGPGELLGLFLDPRIIQIIPVWPLS